eukprot:TRINITY_DN32291_c0_g1_i3.p1 TRINITY_DN32291_c0_g1~~TRINITY_DN32291_c0_g1_i3.p1  ORF type:complete len:264 (-),score=71.79 TRINITY_DN32291_c0_g1_i3:157-948(-)
MLRSLVGSEMCIRDSHDGTVQVKQQGGLLPFQRWKHMFVSLVGGIVVAKESAESREDALPSVSMLQPRLSVNLARSHYVTVAGSNSGLEIYHETQTEAMLWFVALHCSALLARHAATLAAMTAEQGVSWWLAKLEGIDDKIAAGMRTFRDAVATQYEQAHQLVGKKQAQAARMVERAQERVEAAAENALNSVEDTVTQVLNATAEQYKASEQAACFMQKATSCRNLIVGTASKVADTGSQYYQRASTAAAHGLDLATNLPANT